MSSSHGDKPVIIGIGTGRCGTLSLARLLDRQAGFRIDHEPTPLLPWTTKPELAHAKLERYRDDTDFVRGEVASSWLPYLPELLPAWPSVKVICIWREREQTVDSFVTKMKGKYNHWMTHDGHRWRRSPRWDPCFPKYPVDDLREAIRLYWDEYQQRSDVLAERFPGQVLKMNIDHLLNTTEQQRRALRFCGIAESKEIISTGIHENCYRDRKRSVLGLFR